MLSARYRYALVGRVTLADLAAAAAVMLPFLHPPYSLVFLPVETVGGAPAAGAFVPTAESMTAGGFTVALAEAPGLGAAVEVPFTLTVPSAAAVACLGR